MQKTHEWTFENDRAGFDNCMIIAFQKCFYEVFFIASVAAGLKVKFIVIYSCFLSVAISDYCSAMTSNFVLSQIVSKENF